MVPPLPLRRQKAQHLLQRVFLPGIFRDRERFLARKFQKFAIAQRIRHMEAKLARLTRAKKLTWSANQQIGFGDFETVGGTHHRLQARARVLAHPVG